MKVFQKAFKESFAVKFDGEFITVRFDIREKKFKCSNGFESFICISVIFSVFLQRI